MAQHFLKTARLRDFTVWHVSQMTEDEAFEMFVNIRWGDRNHVVCPECGVVAKHYFRRHRRQWRCRDCHTCFSVTTKTLLADRKMPFKKILLGLAEYLSSANGISNHALCRKLNVQVKTASVFVGKLREALFGLHAQVQLSGNVQMDGGHFGGRPRYGRVRKRSPEDIQKHVQAQLAKGKKSNPRSGVTRSNYQRMKANRRVIQVICQVSPVKGEGTIRTIVAVCKSENETTAMQLATEYIKPGSQVWTDENPAYNQFIKYYEHDSVNHSIEFSTVNGVNENQAEAYFSRLRRYCLGVSHRIQPKYMMDVAVEMAFRDDIRKQTELEKLQMLFKAMFKNGTSKWWRGYWQGHMRRHEILWQG